MDKSQLVIIATALCYVVDLLVLCTGKFSLVSLRLCLMVRATVEFQWLEHLRSHVNMFETGVLRANKC